MKPSNDLFRLIKSLDKNEKGYFKKNAQGVSKGKDKNYLLLFDAIDAQEEYNEDALLKKFRTQAFSKQFSVAKNFLFELILKSQRSYRANSSKFMRLNALMENGEVLFEKGLYEEAIKMWDKAKYLASAFDEKPFILDIESWKRRYYVDLKASDWEQNTDPSFEYSFKLLDSYKHTLLLQQKYVKIIKFYKTQPFFRDEETKKEWEKYIDDPLLKNEPEDFYGKLYYLYIFNLYHVLQGNEEAALLSITKIVNLWEDNPSLKEVEPVRYIAAVNNYLLVLGKFERKKEYKDFIDNFIPMEFNSISKEAIFFEHWWLWKAYGYKMELDFVGYKKFFEETEMDIHKFSPFINKVRWLIIRYENALMFMMESKYEKSLEIIDTLIDAKDIDLRKDIQANVRMVYLILHFELENNLLLDSLTRSVKRYLQSNEFYYETERVFIKYFNKLIFTANKTEKITVLTELRDELDRLFTENDRERVAFSNLNLVRWLTARITGVPFLELLQNKS